MSSEPYRVAYVSATGTMLGGGERSLLDLLAGLDPARVRPLVLVPEEGGFAERCRASGVPVRVLPLPPSWRGLLDGTVGRLSGLFREEGVDVVHANSAGRALVLPALAARGLGLPVVWHVRVAEREPLLDRLSAALADRVVVATEFLGGRARAAGAGAKLAVVANPVAKPRVAPGEDGRTWRARQGVPPDAVLAAAFGRLEAQKRLGTAIRALALARRSNSRLRLALVGEGEERAALEELARGCACADAVRFAGWQAEPGPALDAADIVVNLMPGEGFGRAVAEAMALGKPVVANAEGGPAELVAEGWTGLLVRGLEPEPWARTIASLASDPARRAELGRAGSERAARLFDPRVVAGRLAELYDGITGPAGDHD